MLDQSFRQEGERPRRSRRSRWFWMLLVLAAALTLVLRLPSFRMESLELTGAQRLTESEVLAAAGLEAGALRFTHPADAIEQRLMANPWILSARVAWKPRTLHIALTERERVGLIRYHELYYLALDEEGMILEQAELPATDGTPVISGVHAETAVLGRPLPHEGLKDALAVLSRMPLSLRRQVSEAHVNEDRSLTLYMVGGTTVLWGRVPDGRDRIPLTEQKIQNFSGFWTPLGGRVATTCQIDLRVDGKVIPSGCN